MVRLLPRRNNYQKERGPEDEIGRGDDHVHLDPGNALRLQMSDVLLDLDTLGRSDGEKVLAVLTGERNLIESPAVSEQQVSLCSYGTLSVGIYHSLSCPLGTCFSVLTAIENNL